MKILVLSDIHGNYPALSSIYGLEKSASFDHIINCGDSTVYAPFPNETLKWLDQHKTISILGNTDLKVLRLLKGKNFKKPKKAEKRIMYTWTAENMHSKQISYLQSLPKSYQFIAGRQKIGIYHGSPENPNEQLFADTPTLRFRELARKTDCTIILCGHSHTPFHKKVMNVHFINPGSVGRMFDKDPRASYAVLEILQKQIKVSHFRLGYDIKKTTDGIMEALLPPIYVEMFRVGRKLN